MLRMSVFPEIVHVPAQGHGAVLRGRERENERDDETWSVLRVGSTDGRRNSRISMEPLECYFTHIIRQSNYKQSVLP